MARYSGRTSSPLKPVLAIAVVAALAAAILVLDMPSRIAALGGGALDHYTSPSARVAYGDQVHVAGRGERPPLDVTAEKPVPVSPDNRGVRAAKGKHFMGVEFTIRNVGDEVWMSQPLTAIGLDDDAGVTHARSDRVTKLRDARVLPASIRLAPKAMAHGWVVFEVPRKVSPTIVRLVVGQGLTRTAEWSEGRD